MELVKMEDLKESIKDKISQLKESNQYIKLKSKDMTLDKIEELVRINAAKIMSDDIKVNGYQEQEIKEWLINENSLLIAEKEKENIQKKINNKFPNSNLDIKLENKLKENELSVLFFEKLNLITNKKHQIEVQKNIESVESNSRLNYLSYKISDEYSKVQDKFSINNDLMNCSREDFDYEMGQLLKRNYDSLSTNGYQKEMAKEMIADINTLRTINENKNLFSKMDNVNNIGEYIKSNRDDSFNMLAKRNKILKNNKIEN